MLSTPGFDQNGAEKPPPSSWALVEGPFSINMVVCVCAELWVLSLSRWRKVGLPLVLGQESGPNFKGLPKVSGVTTNHWVFLRCDWSLISSWFYYGSKLWFLGPFGVNFGSNLVKWLKISKKLGFDEKLWKVLFCVDFNIVWPSVNPRLTRGILVILTRKGTFGAPVSEWVAPCHSGCSCGLMERKWYFWVF